MIKYSASKKAFNKVMSGTKFPLNNFSLSEKKQLQKDT